MQMRWVTLLSFFPALCGYADTHSELALCDPHETVLFSCATNRAGTDPQHPRSTPRRIVSFCATPMTTAVSGRLTYRFGADKRHVELTYPTDGRPPGKAFTSESHSWAKGSGWSVTFTEGEYLYTVYNRRAVYEEESRSNGGGVRVTHRGKLVTDLWCDGKELSPAIEDNMWRIVQDLPEATPDAP